MTATDLIVDKNDITNTQRIEPSLPSELGVGQILVSVDLFALTSNNLSYAAAGTAMGYWNFFPTDDPGWGRIPVWGYATVTRSSHPGVAVGEQLFGFWPMANHLVMAPADVTEMTFSDHYEHRVELHAWYNRYYRIATDPVSQAGFTELQPVLWALFMTGWELAREFATNNDFGADHVIVGSASSKTAYSFARTMDGLGGAKVIGLTSSGNADFVRGLGCYDQVVLYDELDTDQPDIIAAGGRVAFVDMSGNAAVVRSIHDRFADRLTQSIRVGGTHRNARGDAGELPGPVPRFFFIPDVAEARAAEVGRVAYHAEFAAAWRTFAPWAAAFTTIEVSTGPEAIEAAYRTALAGEHRPSTGTLLTFA